MNIIKDNPFRILGVFSNASAKEIAANTHRISAYQRVNREVSFTSDLPNLLGTCDRNEKAVADAQAKINLPNDKIRYALFWFVKGDDADEIVMRHLAAGNIDKAKQILGMGRIFSFKINLGIISLIQGNYKTGITQITSVIDNDNDRTNFVKSVCGETFQIDKQTLKNMFVDGMLELVSPEQLLNIYKDIYNDPVSTKRIKDKVAAQYLDKIDSEIATAKKVDQKDSAASYNAGVRLMNNTKAPLQKLKDLLGINDMQYKRTADQLANQILQCGINYYNNTSESKSTSINKAYTLQKYAGQIAVGQVAKDRCIRNLDILDKMKDEAKVESDMAYIVSQIRVLNNQMKSQTASLTAIQDAINCVARCKPSLNNIKQELGGSNDTYLNLSDAVINSAMHISVTIINIDQKMMSELKGAEELSVLLLMVKEHVDDSMRLFNTIQGMDMTQNLSSHVNSNRTTLQGLKNTIDSLNSRVNPSGPSSNSGCMVVIVALIIFGCIGALLI